MPKDDDDNLTHFKLWIMHEQNGNRHRTRIKIDPDDIIAAGAFVVALVFALAMVFGSIPINKYTIGIVGFSGSGGAIGTIIKARRRKEGHSPWIERLLILVLIAAFGTYVWATWGWGPPLLRIG